MSTKSELEKLISDTADLITGYKRRAAAIDKQIDRLKPAATALGKLKDDFRIAQKSTRKVFEEKGNWSGEKYKAFCRDGEAVDAESDAYYKLLDKAQDDINTKITELEGQKRKVLGPVGDLLNQIAEWRTELKNAWN